MCSGQQLAHHVPQLMPALFLMSIKLVRLAGLLRLIYILQWEFQEQYNIWLE